MLHFRVSVYAFILRGFRIIVDARIVLVHSFIGVHQRF